MKELKIVALADLETKDIDTLKKEFITLNKVNQQSIFEMGKRLIVLKKKLKVSGENYGDWLKNKANFSQSLANKYVKLIEGYTEENSELVTNLGIKKAYKLLSIEDLEQRIQFIKDNNIINRSYTDICKLLEPTKAITSDSIIFDIHRFNRATLKALETKIKLMSDNKNLLSKEQQEIISIYEDLENKLSELVERQSVAIEGA